MPYFPRIEEMDRGGSGTHDLSFFKTTLLLPNIQEAVVVEKRT